MVGPVVAGPRREPMQEVSGQTLCAYASGVRKTSEPKSRTLPYPSPSYAIPDWRRFGRSHPKTSQIGVGLMRQDIDSRRVQRLFLCVPSCPFVSFVVKGFAFPITAISRDPGDAQPTPSLVIPDWRRFECSHPKASQ